MNDCHGGWDEQGMQYAYSILVGKPEGMKHWEDLDVDRSRWENNNGWILEK